MATLKVFYPLVGFGLVAHPFVAAALGLLVSFSAKWILGCVECYHEKKREVTMRDKLVPTFGVCVLEVIRTMGTSVVATAVLTK